MPKLPPFTLRESPKAKRVILKISAQNGLEVVIPRGFSHRRLPQIIREKQEWIERAFKKIQGAGYLPDHPRELPGIISLNAVNRSFSVEYVPSPFPRLEMLHLNHFSLQIRGDLADLLGCRDLLKRWLQHQGRVHLIPWLEQLSSEIHLSCSRVQIRSQKSRWGSCSGRGTICLNQNLLFVRPELVRYLIIHELCHSVHLNHSAGFYRLLAQFVPDYQHLRAELAKAHNRLPWWAF
jgi:hypothetical protein